METHAELAIYYIKCLCYEEPATLLQSRTAFVLSSLTFTIFKTKSSVNFRNYSQSIRLCPVSLKFIL